jgi:hypothetical protein
VAPTAGYSYEWSTGEETVSIEVNSPGDYTVTATNSNQCQTISTAEVLDAGSDGEGIATYLESIGFYQYPASVQVTVMGEEQLSGEDDQSRNPVNVCDDIECGSSTGVCVKDHANYAIRIAGELMPDLESEVTDHLNYFASEFGYSNIKAFITRNDDICLCPGGYLDQVFSAFSSSEAAFWIHIVDIESSEQDKFYLMSNMPGASSNLPSSTAHRQRLDQSIIRNISDPSTSDFNSNATQSLYGAMFHLLNSHTSIEGEEPEESNPCGNPSAIANYVTPSGVILQLAQGSIPRFNPSTNFKNKLPIGSLTGFLDNDFYYYTGMVRDYFDPTAEDYFLGYYSDSRRPPYTAGVILPQTNHEVQLGIISSLYPSTSNEELASCQRVMVRQVRLSPLVNPNNETGEGTLLNVPFFDAWVATDVLEDEQTFVSEYYINCPPQLSLGQFYSPSEVIVHKNPQTGEVAYYFLYCSKDPQTEEEFCHYVYSYLDATGNPAYKYFDCNQGGWIPYTEPDWESYDVLGGLIFAAWETVVVPVGVTVKIVVDLGAIAGIPAFTVASLLTDIPIGIYFLAEGQVIEGVITLVGAVGGLRAIIQNGTWKLAQQSGSVYDEIKRVFVRKKVLPNGTTEAITVDNTELQQLFQAVDANDLSEEVASKLMNDLLNSQEGIPFLEKMLDNIRTGDALNNISLIKAWDGLKKSPLRNDVSALELGSKMLNDGFSPSHLKNIAKDCSHDIRGLQFADKFAGKTTIENTQIMTRKGFKSGVDNSLEKISNNLDGVFEGNNIDGWQKLKETIDKIDNGAINSHSLTRGADEIATGKQVQIENGNADLEVFNTIPPDNLFTPKSYQLKQVSSGSPSGVKQNIQIADNQLSGANNEIPTNGHVKIAEIQITNSSNPLYNLEESDLLPQLQLLNINISTAEKVVIQNGIDRFIFDVSQL